MGKTLYCRRIFLSSFFLERRKIKPWRLATRQKTVKENIPSKYHCPFKVFAFKIIAENGWPHCATQLDAKGIQVQKAP
jgi:hypothetical protein